jgi:hypothetical protein
MSQVQTRFYRHIEIVKQLLNIGVLIEHLHSFKIRLN